MGSDKKFEKIVSNQEEIWNLIEDRFIFVFDCFPCYGISIFCALFMNRLMFELEWQRKLLMLHRSRKIMNCLADWNRHSHKMRQLHQSLIPFEIGCPSRESLSFCLSSRGFYCLLVFKVILFRDSCCVSVTTLVGKWLQGKLLPELPQNYCVLCKFIPYLCILEFDK